MEEGWLETPYDLRGKRVYVAGQSGMVGRAVSCRLADEDCEVVTASRAALDLTNQADVNAWMAAERPDVVIIAAAKVGGIGANSANPAAFIYDNLMIEANLIHAAHICDVGKLVFLGSSCIYPKEAAQPICESALLSGPLEPTNAPYAVAKIAGIQMCQAYRAQYGRDFISLMPCNLYGPYDRFDLASSHVLPALMMKAYEAVQSDVGTLSVWGSGAPLREFLHADDLADALVFALKNYSSGEILNIGSGADISIKDLARMVATVAGFEGEIIFDPSKPDGTFRKLMDSSRIHNAGWKPQTELRKGIENTYQWYLDSFKGLEKVLKKA